MIDNRLKELWPRLQSKKPHLPHFLDEVRLSGIRGIRSLKVPFDYPVSVIAGGNASGKSTVLFATASAYKVPGAGVKDFVPSTLFPDYRPRHGDREDERQPVTIEFEYSTPNGRRSMRWRRVKGWNRSFFGRKGAAQPERPVYLRTLTNLSNPSEVRGVLRMSHLKDAPEETSLTASQINFAQQMLPFSYSDVVHLSSGKKSLLFAEQETGASYSELHMAAGERAILRLSLEIAQLRDALVLIDEVEAGLHPWVQQLLMLQLQQLALRNDLQVIVTSHSPVVLDSVPGNGRIFLERGDDGQVTLYPAHRDIIRNALYGRSRDALNLLCEDDTAEGILNGVLDHLIPKERIRRESIQVGRNTGADEFPMHAAAFRKFGLLDNFVFVLDGDQKHSDVESENTRERRQNPCPNLVSTRQTCPGNLDLEAFERGAPRLCPRAGNRLGEPGQRNPALGCTLQHRDRYRICNRQDQAPQLGGSTKPDRSRSLPLDCLDRSCRRNERPPTVPGKPEGSLVQMAHRLSRWPSCRQQASRRFHNRNDLCYGSALPVTDRCRPHTGRLGE